MREKRTTERIESMSMTITEFLLARIAEDEEVARAAAQDGGGESWQISVMHGAMVQLNDGTEWGGETVIYDEGRPGEEQAAHIARHDPARVLAECEAKRRIVEWWDGWDGSVYDGWTEAASIVLGMMSTVYADHPDYREEWRA